MSDHSDNTRQATAIGKAITRLHRERYGRGATTTRTVFQRNHTLIDANDWEQVKVTRQAFQMAMRPAFSTAVEDITGRTVVAFMSQVHLDPDLAAEIFVLSPDGDDPVEQ
jgi:uncharacterized protein YbcI